MKIFYGVIFGMAFTGCAGLSQDLSLLFDQAQKAYLNGDYYKARQMTQQVLDRSRDNQEAEKLMAEILDKEISLQKDLLGPQALEEYTPDEKSQEAKLWLDRAKTLLAVHQYEEALLAAEKVFLYEPENHQASRLIDEIRRQAQSQSKKDDIFAQDMIQDEIKERVLGYRQQARKWMAMNRWGAATLAVEKILMLVPNDKEALKLYEEIQQKQKAA